jgi:RND family efflux transporter MFP subunit
MAKRGLKPRDIANVPVQVGLMNEEGYPHTGKLDYVAPMIDPSTGTLSARGIFQNADRAMLPGNFLRIRIPLALEEETALLVPDTAIGADQGGSYLLVVDQNGVVQQKSVTTGQLVGKLRVIASGISAGEQVVVSGIQRAIPGEKVAPQSVTITAEGVTSAAGKS